jgi:hypothetical protein
MCPEYGVTYLSGRTISARLALDLCGLLGQRDLKWCGSTSPIVDIARTLRTTDGVSLAYHRWRPGPPRRLLVLVHGLASNHTRWTEFVRTTRLRQSWDLLRVDLRGFGGSLTRRRVGLDVWSRDLGQS